MDPVFYTNIANSTAHRPVRESLSREVLENPRLFPDLLEIALDIKDKNYHKACWVLELVCEARTEWPNNGLLDAFCKALPSYTNESAIRPMSKICLFLAERHIKKSAFLTEEQLQQIIEACFDWLIGDTKVASKAYAMKALYLFGKQQEWIVQELKHILDKDFPLHSAAYQSAAKDILVKITRTNTNYRNEH